MKPGNEISSLEILFECLSKIWSPGGEALRLQKELNIRSLKETAAAAGRTGGLHMYGNRVDQDLRLRPIDRYLRRASANLLSSSHSL
jgi:hypothetical protein